MNLLMIYGLETVVPHVMYAVYRACHEPREEVTPEICIVNVPRNRHNQLASRQVLRTGTPVRRGHANLRPVKLQFN
jgi:hypothetical protein